MTTSFVDFVSTDGTRILINTSFVITISPTHGENFDDGIDIVFFTFGSEAVAQVSVPASKVEQVLIAVKKCGNRFVDIAPIGSQRFIMNTEYVTHVLPTHGANLSDGAQVGIFGTTVQVPASAIPALMKAIGS